MSNNNTFGLKKADSIANNNHIIELKAYNPPKAVENRQDDWVKFGDKNDYYQFLIDRYNNSTTNNQVINNIVKLIFGKGLDARDAARKPNEYAQMKMLFSKETTKRAVTDMYLLGQCALQVIYSKNKKTIVDVQHMPVHLLRPQKCNKEGIIENYYYSDNWDKLRDFPPTLIPSFGNGDRTLEILMIGNYTIGQKYFSSVSYLGGVSYAKLEEDISEYLISLVETGFTPLKIINFNNGIPTEDQQRTINDSVVSQTTGASGKKLIVSFNSEESKKTTIDSVGLDNAAQQYEYLSNEARAKIMLSHGVTSGLLFGIPTASGFSSNADELKTAFVLFDNNVIIPNQEQFCDGIDKILAYNGISLDLTFKPLNPLVDAMHPEDIAPVQMSEEVHDHFDIDSLEGESITDEWELVDKREYSDKNISIEDWANSLIVEKKTTLQKLADIIKSNPSAKSYLDKDTYKVRYEYSEIAGTDRAKSRSFCKQMMSRTSSGVVYRKEDIDQASFQGVNNTFGHEGQNYSLWLYVGGKYCHHFWSENLYRLKTKTDGTPYKDKALSSSEEVNSIAGYNPNPAGLEIAKIAPINRPGRGEYPQ